MPFPFECLNCKHALALWHALCPTCGHPDKIVARALSVPVRRTRSTPRLSDISASDVDRLVTKIDSLDEVSGGGLVVGASTFLAGSPGAGKSTLALQAACHIAVTHNTIYFSGEEDLARLRVRADRLRLPITQLRVSRLTRADQIIALTKYERARLIVVDSLQSITRPDLRNRAGSPTQLVACAASLTHAAQQLRCTVLLIGHVNKEDDLAGPRTLEHDVDVMLHFTAKEESSERILYASKNRFGPSFIRYTLTMQGHGGF